MKAQRAYTMDLRAAAAGATRERILDTAAEAFLEHWYDDVTIASVAKHAGVSGQTVLNHFGGKAQLEDYETAGDTIVRLLALEEKVPSRQPLLARGRESHREWVETMFQAPALTPELVVATDVYTWKLLRREQGLSRDETVASI